MKSHLKVWLLWLGTTIEFLDISLNQLGAGEAILASPHITTDWRRYYNMWR